MQDDSFSALLREPVATVSVRVRPGCAIQTYEDHAPSASKEMFLAGELIENLDVAHAMTLVAAGLVEAV